MSDPKLFFCWRSGAEAYRELPHGFIRDGYLEEQRRMLPANRFNRLHLNEWGQRDVGFLTDVELAGITAPRLLLLERSQEPHVLAVDYGRVKDHAAEVLLRKGSGAGDLLVSQTRLFQGSPDQPVPLEAMESSIIEFHERFHLVRIVIDPYQMLGTAERLAKRFKWPLFDTEMAEKAPFRKAIVLRPIGPHYLNRLTMGLLGACRSKQLQIPGACVDLLAQLGSVVTKETFYGVRIDSGTGVGVRAHDDLVIALGMALTELSQRGSGVELSAFQCLLDQDHERRCFLRDPIGGLVWPQHGRGPQCAPCAGWQALEAAHARFQAITGKPIDIHVFNRDHVERGRTSVSFARAPEHL